MPSSPEEGPDESVLEFWNFLVGWHVGSWMGELSSSLEVWKSLLVQKHFYCCRRRTAHIVLRL